MALLTPAADPESFGNVVRNFHVQHAVVARCGPTSNPLHFRRRLNYLKPIETANRMQLKGFSASPADYDLRVENRKTRAGVRVTSDRALSDMVFWTSPRTTCPEAYIHVHSERGRPMDWKTTYDFYSLPGASK